MKKKTSKSFDISKYYPLIFTIIFVFILFQYSFATLEAIFYDLRVRYDIGASFSDEIVLVTLDEESDEFLGENYPYTFASHHNMFEKLAADKPKIVNYIVNLSSPDTVQGKQDLAKFKGDIKDYIANNGNFRFAAEIDMWEEVLPPEELREFGYSYSIINIDNAAFSKDDVSRRMILNFSGEDTIHLWTANKYRELTSQSKISSKSVRGSYYWSKADATFALFRYFTNPLEEKSKIKTIPFHRVRVGNFPPGFFKDKIVLVGSKYVSNASDYILTPYNKSEYKTPKVNLHAVIIQALNKDKTVYQVPTEVTYVLCILIAIFLSITISKVKPTHGLLITLCVMVGIFIISYLMFIIFGLWLYLTHLVLTVFVVYYIWVPFRAIGEYQRRYAIQEEAKLLKKVEHLKQNFISLMSHDLKTPVAKIAGIADISIQMANEGELKSNFYKILDSTKELNHFITSILDLTKVESRNITLNMTAKDVNQVVEQIVKALNPLANEKSIRIETSLSPLYPIEVDQELLKRILSNLTENAIKYAGESAAISIETWDDEKWVYIAIADSGVGIPEDALEHIFDKFYRVKNDASHTIKGTGLGLYLVKYFVELHGGEISVESKVGQGTKFTVKLLNQ